MKVDQIKENMVRISMVAGMLVKEEAIQADSKELINAILALAEKFEQEMASTIQDGEYSEMIDLFAHQELLKMFGNTDLFLMGILPCEDADIAIFHFYVKEDCDLLNVLDGKVVKISPLCEHVMRMLISMKGYDSRFVQGQLKYKDNVITVQVKRKGLQVVTI